MLCPSALTPGNKGEPDASGLLLLLSRDKESLKGWPSCTATVQGSWANSAAH
jgi:hypothetical protein